jgi:lipopolysaccharide transport system permease protein
MISQRIIIEPKTGWRQIDWKELYEYRDLFVFLVMRSIKVRYAQSVLGIGWAIIQPVFSMIVFTVVFGRLAKIDSEGVPYALFSFAALVPWTYFANSLTEATSSLVGQAHIINKIYFPRLLLPFSSVVAKLLDFAIAMLILFGLMAAYGMWPNIGILSFPVLILLMMLSSAGLGLWLTAMAIQYRDVAYASSFIVQLLMYAAPVVYPSSLIPEKYRLLYAINPMVGVIEGFRAALLGTTPMPWHFIGLGMLVSSFLFISGALYFRKKERFFADVA